MRGVKKILLGSVCAFTYISAFASQNASAAEADAASVAPAVDPEASEDGSSSGDIVVTANKRSENLSNVASSVSVLGGAQLNTLKAVQLSDYLGFIPGVSMAPQGAPGFSQIYIRGITTVGVGSTVGVYVDEAPFGSSSANGYAGLLKLDIDPSDLERIEVLKGPQGTLYGAATVGGLLKYVTKSPDLDKLTYGGELTGEAVDGGGQGFAVRAHANVPLLTDRVALRISGFSRRDAGFIDNVALKKDNANYALSNGIYATLKAQATERLTLKVSALYQDLNARGINSVAVDSPTGAPVDLDTVKPLYGRFKTDLLGDQGNKAIAQLYALVADYEVGTLTLTSASSYSKVHDIYQSGDNGASSGDFGAPAEDYVNAKSDVHTEKFTEELRLASPSEQPFSWMAGFFYNHEKSSVVVDYTVFKPNNEVDHSAGDGIGFHQDSPSIFKEWAVFANATWRFAPDFDIAAGIRYSRYDQSYSSSRNGLLVNPDDTHEVVAYPQVDSSQDAVSVMSTASWHFEKDGLFYLRFATGFRPGGPRIFPPGAVLPVGSVDHYDSEHLNNYEIGFRKRFFGGLLGVDAAAFLLDYNGLQGNIRIGRFGVTGNAGDATVKGAELNVDVRPARGLRLGGAFGYVHSTLDADSTAFGAKAGDAMPFAPRVTASATVDYERPISNGWNVLIGADYRYVSHQFTDFESASPTRIKPYGLANARVGLRSPQGVEISAYVKNLANNYVYTNNISPGFEGSSYLSVLAPRTFGLSITINR